MADNDDKADDKPNEELSDSEQDALNSVSDVKGSLTDNEEPLTVEEPNEESDKDSNGELPVDSSIDEPDEEQPSDNPDEEGEYKPDTPPESTPELTPEADPEGVYEDKPVEDPGAFQPGDYSFEIKTADGKTHKISTPEDIDAFAASLDDNPESITASQFSVFNRKSALMEQGIASDKKVFDEAKAEYDRVDGLNQTRESHLKQWNNEINYLSGEGKLPEISDANNKADWSDPEIAKDPAVSARLELLQWMTTENDKRISSGLEPMSSLIDAFNARRLEQIESQNDEDKKNQTADRRKRGGRIGGNAPFQPDNSPKNSIQGPGGTLSDLVSEYLLENQ